MTCTRLRPWPSRRLGGEGAARPPRRSRWRTRSPPSRPPTYARRGEAPAPSPRAGARNGAAAGGASGQRGQLADELDRALEAPPETLDDRAPRRRSAHRSRTAARERPPWRRGRGCAGGARPSWCGVGVVTLAGGGEDGERATPCGDRGAAAAEARDAPAGRSPPSRPRLRRSPNAVSRWTGADGAELNAAASADPGRPRRGGDSDPRAGRCRLPRGHRPISTTRTPSTTWAARCDWRVGPTRRSQSSSGACKFPTRRPPSGGS